MCGIAGFVDKRGALSEEQKGRVLRDMLARIRHRGPDGEGIEQFSWGGTAQARLKILDLTSAAHQPMWNADRTLVVSYNGEIYNHREVRRDLPALAFRSSGDTETLLYAYATFGRSCLNRLKGMFAISLFDASKRELFIAIDRFGIKPLYYIDTPEWFAWSSEVKAFRALPNFTFRVRESVLGEQLMFRSVAGPATLFADVQKVLPGESLTYDLETAALSSHTYWHPVPRVEGSIGERIERSVEEHLLSDVPLGVQLSGGLDSSLISTLVRRAVPDSQELHSFSIGLADTAWNEFPHSQRVAKLLKTVHHELLFDEERFCEELPRATYHYDEPIHHSHSVPMMLLAREAKPHVTVLMSGEGADEIFGGYRRYLQFAGKAMPADEVIVRSNAFVGEEMVRRVFSGNIDVSARSRIVAEARSDGIPDPIAAYDIRTYLTTLLLRQDKMGMASGLENRVPFLDHELVETALSLSLQEKISGGEGKLPLKKYAESLLPYDIVHRGKVGFGQPIAVWLRNPRGFGRYLPMLLEAPRQSFGLQYDSIAALIREHYAGIDHGAILWNLITLELWARIFLDCADPASVWPSLPTVFEP